ncbi:coiled-coil domain-containing protein 3-like [Branchiostoma lanceolatum]|uniref:coiled-coil domain-containing protein 3-like n=1 Tax=Branchiostoma lanceolatum TaxID=7740 RepID=UPI003453DEC9
MQRCFLLSLAVAMLAVQPARGCSQPDGYMPWSINDRVQAADMVVWGRVVAKHGLKEPPSTSYTAEVSYGCHVHGDTTTLHPTFMVTKMGYENVHQCVAHNVDVGSYYFFFLTYGEEEVLIPQDINQQSAVVPDTPENRLEFSLCCGFTLSVCQPESLTTSQPQTVLRTTSQPQTVPQTTSQPQTVSQTTSQSQTVPSGTNPAVAMTMINVSMTTQNLTDSMMTEPDMSVGGASHLGMSAILVLLSSLVVVVHFAV